MKILETINGEILPPNNHPHEFIGMILTYDYSFRQKVLVSNSKGLGFDSTREPKIFQPRGDRRKIYRNINE